MNVYALTPLQRKELKEKRGNIKLGQAIEKLLNLKPIKENDQIRFNTTWGTKTHEGLGACIKRIIKGDLTL